MELKDILIKDNITLRNVDVIHAKQAAFSILMKKNNFIHSIDHVLRVHDNAMHIFTDVGDKSIEKMIALKLAAYWHDTGRDDWNEKEEVPHNITSAEFFKSYAVEQGFSNEIIDITQSIILCHRNSGSTHQFSPTTIEEKILWDADKLDIVNSLRVTEIVSAYLGRYETKEFNLKNTTAFWMNISIEFANKFYFEISRDLFCKRYNVFKQLVESINLSLSSAKDLQALTNKITEIFSKIVRSPLQTIDVNKTFSELGMDSILGFEFIEKINEYFNCNISTAALYKHKKISQFIEYLQSKMKKVEVDVK